MKALTVAENERLSVGPHGDLTRAEADKLQRFDEAHASRTGTTVFDWTRRDWIAARGYVGVVQIPGLAVEILPKTDGQSAQTIRNNLLHMIHVGRLLKARRRSLASLSSQEMPLIDALALAFAESLLDALRGGLDKAYVQRQGNLRVLRGRLLVDQQIRHNSLNRERLFVRYDEFSEDSLLNRVLKATCRLLSTQVRAFEVSRKLNELAIRFDQVSDIRPGPADLHTPLTRQNARFQMHLDFCRLVWSGQSTSLSSGAVTSFSLLFSMHRVFESFIAALLKRNKDRLGLPLSRVSAQGRGPYLLQNEEGRGLVRLRPDIVGVGHGGETLFILDTKWKLVESNRGAPSPSLSDAYQMHAYARRYDSPLTILLFPATPGLRTRALRFADSGHRLLLGFVDLNRDLRREQDEVLEDLRVLLGDRSEATCREA